MIRSTSHLLLLSILATGTAGRAQDAPAPALPDAAEILDQWQALERERAEIPPPKSFTASGSCEFVLQLGNQPAEPVVGSWHRAQKGERYVMHSEFPHFGARAEGFDGKVAWELDPAAGVVIKEGDARAQALRINHLPLARDWRDHYRAAETLETTEVNDQPCWKLRLTPNEGDDELWFLSQETPRLAGVDLRMAVGMGVEDVSVRMAKYTLSHGIDIETEMSVEFGVVSITFFTDKFELNADVDDAELDLPEQVAEAVAEAAKAAKSDDPDITISTLEERDVVFIRAKVKQAEIGSLLSIALPEVIGYLRSEGVQPAGPPYTRFHNMTGDVFDMEAGFPVAKELPGKDRILPGTLPAGKAASIFHYGHYETIHEAHVKLQAWCDANGMETSGAPWEMYWTDPAMEADPAKWRSQVLWPIK
ncbi:MAG: GyrI-like domain-containing protein [Planctomycetota bacterium]